MTRLYRRFMRHAVDARHATLGVSRLVVVLLVGSMSLVYIGFVKVKMLPFDNKSEFQVMIDMPNGTTLEETLARRSGLRKRFSSSRKS